MVAKPFCIRLAHAYHTVAQSLIVKSLVDSLCHCLIVIGCDIYRAGTHPFATLNGTG